MNTPPATTALRPGRRPPVIALLTDFGLRDHYVASMKGVVLGICPDATLLDITHDIPPQDILAGALELEAVAPYLPEGSIVLAVVDPGVGSTRRGVVVDTGRLRLVGPDNGLFTLVMRAAPQSQAFELANRDFQRAVVSRTFEGRDRFGPAAAWLAAGVSASEFGRRIADPVMLAIPEALAVGDMIDGAVLRVDRFGNLITNIGHAMLSGADSDLEVAIAGASVRGLVSTYAASPPGRVVALIGSTGRLEIAVNSSSAADHLQARRGTAVRVRVIRSSPIR